MSNKKTDNKNNEEVDQSKQHMEDKKHGDKGQPLIKHLLELRKRILRSIVAILVIFAGLFYFSNDIYIFISEPLRANLPEGSTMIATEVASPFLAPFKLSMVLSLFIAVPYILHQAWGFIAPGLYHKEKKLAIPLLVASIFAVLFRDCLCLFCCVSASIFIFYFGRP